MKKRYDCPPTLTDAQVLEFCKNGFLMLEGVVSDDVNRRTLDYLDASEYPVQHEPTEIMEEHWFAKGVICNDEAAGAVRSLLGCDFGLPILMSNHRVACPAPVTGGWHRDGCSKHETELHTLQVFYYPQDCPRELGPTELLPGSHFLFSPASRMAHYGSIRGGHRAASPAGSIFITAYPIWHRRSASTAAGTRNMLKYNYRRSVRPTRDWISDPEFDFARGENYVLRGATFREQFRDCHDAARMFLWLCGWGDRYEFVGGQTWPLPGHWSDHPYGYPLEDVVGSHDDQVS